MCPLTANPDLIFIMLMYLSILYLALSFVSLNNSWIPIPQSPVINPSYVLFLSMLPWCRPLTINVIAMQLNLRKGDLEIHLIKMNVHYLTHPNHLVLHSLTYLQS